MYLEKIEIIGFKSFADKTVIHFSEPITAIVGPNGCGKSNVVDAFRWVLGGPSAKSLRSEKMVDVIFSGTDKRKPLNYAQISLTFTNVDKSISLDYQEICISRRLYRSGESEWHINRNPVRLKDIHKLLWEAGLGKNAFYIFEQGKIDELITSSPLERRNIFEEAAKIMHFKEKRREAFRRLSQVEANLKRVFDIQGEVTKQIESLKKQAEEAKIYKTQKEDLQRLDKELIISKWQQNDIKQKIFDQEIKEKTEAEAQIKKETSLLDSKLKELKEVHHKKSQEAKTAYEAFFEAKKSKELASFEFKTHQKKIEELFEQKSALRQKLQTFHQKHLEEHKTYLGNQDLLEKEQTKLSELLKERDQSSFAIQDLEEKVTQESALRKESQQKLLGVVNSENQLGSNLKTVLTQLENAIEHQDTLNREEKKAAEFTTEKTALLTSLESQKDHTSKILKELESTLQNLNVKINENKILSEKSAEHLDHLTQQLHEKKTKVEFLQKLKDDFDGYGKATKALLRYSKDSSHLLFEKLSPLTDWMIPEAGFEECLSSLLGLYSQTLIVKTKEDLKLTLDVAKKENLQGYSLLCLADLDKNLSSTQKMAKQNPVSNHFLSNIHEEKEFLPQLDRQSLIDKSLFFDEKKVLHHLAQEKNNLFLREKELKEYQVALLKIESEEVKAKEKHQSATVSLEKLFSEQSQKTKELQESKMKLAELVFKIKNCQEDLAKIESDLKGQFEKKVELSKAIETLNTRQKELAKAFESEKNKRSELESHFKKMEQQFESHFNILGEKRSLRRSLEEKINHLEKNSRGLQENIKIFESKSEDFEEQVSKMNQEIDLNEKNFSTLEEKTESYISKEKELSEKLALANQFYHSFEDALEKLEQEQKEIEEKRAELRQNLDEIQKKDLEINNKRAEAIAENNLYLEEITEKYQLSKEELSLFEIEEDFSISKTEKDVRRLRKSLENFTEINLKAMSDCKEQEERFAFLESQIKDLNTSQDKLTEIIKELDNTSRKMFLETFESIRSHFRTNYALLFNGGEADLKLSSSEDILEAGIEIIAQPPGKKMRSIQQLSGGEKCLTAVALLFALFETQSIPFCILDEIDAPLDDTNVERFTNVLKQFVKNHQFIIITHNKRTMAMADKLLGISMEEKGVTKVIPFEFNKEPKETKQALSV